MTSSTLTRPQPSIDLSATVNILKMAVPDWEWLLRHLESTGGYLCVPRQVTDFMDRIKINNYPLLYQGEALISNGFLRSMLSEQDIRDLNGELSRMSPEERGHAVEQLIGQIKDSVEVAEKHIDSRSQEELNAQFLVMSNEAQADAIRMVQWLGMSCLSMFHQVLSVMIHREKLTSLVAQAKAGDDSAFVKAVQIDPRILGVDPYFRSRFDNLHAEGNEAFRKKLSYRLQCAPYRGKVRHKSLWMALAFLDMCGQLDRLTYPEMLNLLDEVGVGGYENRIEDVKYLAKRVVEYRAFQKQMSSGLSTP